MSLTMSVHILEMKNVHIVFCNCHMREENFLPLGRFIEYLELFEHRLKGL